jgi:hypothetical protein
MPIRSASRSKSNNYLPLRTRTRPQACAIKKVVGSVARYQKRQHPQRRLQQHLDRKRRGSWFRRPNDLHQTMSAESRADQKHHVEPATTRSIIRLASEKGRAHLKFRQNRNTSYNRDDGDHIPNCSPTTTSIHGTVFRPESTTIRGNYQTTSR